MIFEDIQRLQQNRWVFLKDYQPKKHIFSKSKKITRRISLHIKTPKLQVKEDISWALSKTLATFLGLDNSSFYFYDGVVNQALKPVFYGINHSLDLPDFSLTRALPIGLIFLEKYQDLKALNAKELKALDLICLVFPRSQDIAIEWIVDSNTTHIQSLQAWIGYFSMCFRQRNPDIIIDSLDFNLPKNADFGPIWGVKETAPPWWKLMVERVASADQTEPAFIMANQIVYYDEFYRKIHRAVSYLNKQGILKGDLVPLYFPRSPEYWVHVFALWILGAVCVFLDQSWPKNRVQKVITKIQPKVMLVDKFYADFEVETQISMDEFCLIEDSVDKNLLEWNIDLASQDMAYILFTSGTTGEPKGVCVSHGNLSYILQALKQDFGMKPKEKIIGLTNFTFDMCLTETFYPLMIGATCCLLSHESQKDPAKWSQLIYQERPEWIQATPSQWQIILKEKLPRILNAVTGGERLTPSLFKLISSKADKLFNAYGPTETTLYVSAGALNAKSRIHLGKPFDNVGFLFLDSEQHKIPLGCIGELALLGDCVSLGYFNAPELTRRAYLIDYLESKEVRYYRSGDWTRWHPDGYLLYVDRLDRQFKVRGCRVEAAEIEALTLMIPSIENCRVEYDMQEKVLLLWVLTQDKSVTTKMLREYFKQHLPSYALPNRIYILDAFPMNHSGKLDLSALASYKTEDASEE
jgi:amino acid adenylation domain-containing protein